MRPCFQIEFATPKKVCLNGLWFGPQKPKRAIVWVHGLGSSMFTKLAIVERLIDRDTAVLVFNNRGHDKLAAVPVVKGKKRSILPGGAAHENFIDSADDIQGAVEFARRRGVKNIFLAGHSTGCQKSTYWSYKKRERAVKGVILLAPMSDHAALRVEYDASKIARALSTARALVRRGKSHELLPSGVWNWPWIADAQRFVSLYGGNGPEEIFTYWDPRRDPRTVHSIKIPVLVLLAERDEFADRPAQEIAAWFEKHLRAKHAIVVVPKASHSFRGAERKVASAIREFMK